MTPAAQQPEPEVQRLAIIIEGKNELFGLTGHYQEVCSLCSKYHTKIISSNRTRTRTRPHTPAPATTNGVLSGFIPSTNCGSCDEWDAAVDELTRVVYFKTKRMDIRSLVAEAAFSVRQDQNWMQRHDTAIARTATLAENKRVLDAAIRDIKIYNATENGFKFTANEVINILESLRQEAQQ